MIYLNKFDTHSSYEEKLNGGGVDFKIPNVSYCKDANDVHFNPYNLIEFYVGDITGTPQTVKIYTDSSTSVDVTVSEGNKWYSYLLPKDNGLYKIESGIYDGEQHEWSNGIVKKVVVKSNINYNYDENNDRYNGIVPWEITEASFKGSNTSKVTNMNCMFQFCRSLTSLDVSSFDTSKVIDMMHMFKGCSGLTSLDLSNFNTSNVTNMNTMFYDCRSLTSLDLSGWDTNNVTDMRLMFNGCISLTSLDLSNFNTSNVTYMSYMFYNCSCLTSLDVSNFNTSKVTYMDSMFKGCSGLKTLDLSGWDTSKVTNMRNMFNGCSPSLTIRMVGCSTDTVNKIKTQLTKDKITEFTIIQ